MITRAQAEALLTLAESLEACERLGVTFRIGDDFLDIVYRDGFDWYRIDALTAADVRLAVIALIPGGLFTANLIQNRLPKQET